MMLMTNAYLAESGILDFSHPEVKALRNNPDYESMIQNFPDIQPSLVFVPMQRTR